MSKSSHGLTSKQLHFCRLVAAGTMSNAEAYRQAYDSTGTKKTSMEAASRLMADSKVRAMVESIYAKKERVLLDRGLSHRDLIISKLNEAIDDNDFGVNRLKAISLMADVLGMKRSGLDVTKEDIRSAATITAELEAKLSALGLDETVNSETVMNLDDDIDHDSDIDLDNAVESSENHDSTRH